MNLQIMDRIPREKIEDVMRSVLVFLAILIFISVVGVIFSVSH